MAVLEVRVDVEDEEEVEVEDVEGVGDGCRGGCGWRPRRRLRSSGGPRVRGRRWPESSEDMALERMN